MDEKWYNEKHMPAASKPANEEERLAALRRYNILDTPDEAAYNDITRLVAHICQAPIAVVNLIDRDRQWFKSEIGLGVRETPLDPSICAHAILQPEMMIVPDTLQDERFATNPLVTGDPYLRFYAGALLETSDGYALGTLCVLDYTPRLDLTDDQKDALQTLARQVMSLMELRLLVRQQEEVIREREQAELALRATADALRSSHEREYSRLTDIFMRAPAFMAALRGPDHVFELANLPYYQLIGRREGILGKTVAEVLPEIVDQGLIRLLDKVYQTGQAHVGTDTRVVFQLADDSPPDERFVDFTFQPLLDEDGGVSGILVHGVDLTDHKRLEQERERLLEEQQTLLAQTRARAEREALLNQIGAAVRSTLEPESILQAAVSLLGQGLQADRCYFVRYHQTHDTAQVAQEWLRDTARLEPLAGLALQMSAYSVDRDAAYRAGNTHIVEDVVAYAPEEAAPLLALNVRALLRVPIVVGDQMTALSVAMAREPRRWTENEARLVENVAALVRSALEAAHTQQRERNIAQQLQAALQPPPPPDLPGLFLDGFYQPALEEAGVGGDFYDVFPIEKGCTALVVADLSGKGLAAASQVATVRNMLRHALYSSPGATLAEAVTDLNQVLVEFELLTGFATLFVGLYDHNLHTLTYVNCGQEPGLIWRVATGAVEELPPTGPVLGGFDSGRFAESTVALNAGDALTVFTDGLTEVGPTRRDLLDLSGVSALFQECCATLLETGSDTPLFPETDNAAGAVLSRLVAGVDAYARGGTRDDVCLLVGIATG